MLKQALLCLALGAPSAQGGITVLVLTTGDPAHDSRVAEALTAAGHTVVAGPQFHELSSAGPLAGADAVYLQPNFHWPLDMPLAGQEALVAFVAAGGGLVTSEWTHWKIVSSVHLQALRDVLPVTSTGALTSGGTAIFEVATSDPVMSAGLPASFEMPLTSFSGTETRLETRPEAVAFYTTTSFGAGDWAGVAGWDYGNGRVVSFSTTNGLDQLRNANFARLLGNAFTWVDSCYADCDASGSLDFFDFLCFQNAFAAGARDADCDASGSLDFFDFLCFQDAFAAGCS